MSLRYTFRFISYSGGTDLQSARVFPRSLPALARAGRTDWAVRLDALGGVVISSAERSSLTWLAGFEAATVENIAAVITRARRTR